MVGLGRQRGVTLIRTRSNSRIISFVETSNATHTREPLAVTICILHAGFNRKPFFLINFPSGPLLGWVSAAFFGAAVCF